MGIPFPTGLGHIRARCSKLPLVVPVSSVVPGDGMVNFGRCSPASRYRLLVRARSTTERGGGG